jgi:hypothetical protein
MKQLLYNPILKGKSAPKKKEAEISHIHVSEYQIQAPLEYSLKKKIQNFTNITTCYLSVNL